MVRLVDMGIHICIVPFIRQPIRSLSFLARSTTELIPLQPENSRALVWLRNN